MVSPSRGRKIMDKKFLYQSIGWGIGLWLIGYVLGIIFFMIMPANLIGWVISPIGILITLWVLLKKVKGDDMIYYLKIAIVWTAIAVVFDYLFLVLLFKPADGYYKLDVYFYYTITFIFPLLVGIFKTRNPSAALRAGQKNLPDFLRKQEEAKRANLDKILKFLETREKIANNDIEKLLGVSNATAERYLNELEKEGILKQVGNIGQGVYYTKI